MLPYDSQNGCLVARYSLRQVLIEGCVWWVADHMTKVMKTLTIGRARAGKLRMPGWDP